MTEQMTEQMTTAQMLLGRERAIGALLMDAAADEYPSTPKAIFDLADDKAYWAIGAADIEARENGTPSPDGEAWVLIPTGWCHLQGHRQSGKSLGERQEAAAAYADDCLGAEESPGVLTGAVIRSVPQWVAPMRCSAHARRAWAETYAAALRRYGIEAVALIGEAAAVGYSPVDQIEAPGEHLGGASAMAPIDTISPSRWGR